MPERSCGGCTKCCEIVPVAEINKPAGQQCRFARDIFHTTGPGCSIYLRRPRSCASWSCLWLKSPNLPPELRPDRSGIVLDEAMDLVQINGVDKPAAQVWVAAGHDGDLRDNELVHQVILGLLDQVPAILWRLPKLDGKSQARTIFFDHGRLVISQIHEPTEGALGGEMARMARLAELAPP
jgi:hypothetical protein